MAAVTLEIAQQHYNAWLAADMALTTGKEYKLANGINLTREDAGQVRQQLIFWEKRVNRLSTDRTLRMFQRVTPFDL